MTAYLHLLGSVGRLLSQKTIVMVGLWHMVVTDRLQYIGWIGGRNEEAARCVSYIPTTPRLGMVLFSSLRWQWSALALGRALSSVLYASMIGPYLAFIVPVVSRAILPDCLFSSHPSKNKIHVESSRETLWVIIHFWQEKSRSDTAATY